MQLNVRSSRARDRAELVTDDKAALRKQLEAVTGERIAALEGVGEAQGRSLDLDKDAHKDRAATPDSSERVADKSPDRGAGKTAGAKPIEHDLGL